MRVLLGWLILFGLAAVAGLGTAYWRAHARERSDSVTSVQAADALGVPAVITFGAPSGASPISLPEDPRSIPLLRAPDPTDPEPRSDPTPRQPEPFELKVRPGNVLSKICQDFYTERGHRSLSAITERVAAWNGLSSANDLKAGQIIQLPTLEQLFP